jgi:TRAP-type C4-dicarboxylate transport system permease small subunit
VTLLLTTLRGPARRAMEIWALGAATLLAGLAAWYSVRLAWQSHAFDDISTGNDATPLWIPQLAMVAGNLLLLLAFVDDFVLELRGRRTAVDAGATAHE